MGVPQAIRDLVDDVELANRGERDVVADQRGQGVAIDVLHGDVELPLVIAHVVDGDDVGVLEPPGRLRLPHQSATKILPVDSEQLQRHVPVDDRVARQVEHPHAALAEEALDVVPADNRGDFTHGGS